MPERLFKSTSTFTSQHHLHIAPRKFMSPVIFWHCTSRNVYNQRFRFGCQLPISWRNTTISNMMPEIDGFKCVRSKACVFITNREFHGTICIFEVFNNIVPTTLLDKRRISSLSHQEDSSPELYCVNPLRILFIHW